MNELGFTLIEALVAILLTGIVGAAAFEFFVIGHNNMLVQENVSDMQQNVRAGTDEIVRQLKNAGANLPKGIQPIYATNTNPDTLEIRYAAMGGSVEVGDHTQKKQANPIHVATTADLSQFQEGQQAYIWHANLNTGEWFTITKLATNNGVGWQEIHHGLSDLLNDPLPGDLIIALQQMRYYINRADTAHPTLMRIMNGSPAQIYADNIDDLQCSFRLSDGSTVQSISINDTVYVAGISLSSHTEQVDAEAAKFGHDGRRHRALATQVLLRNNRY